MKNFRHLSNASLVFGEGIFNNLAGMIPGRGPVLFVTGGHFALAKEWTRLESLLQAEDRTYTRETVSGEPSPETVDALADAARKARVEAVVAIGGGSVLDAGKATAAMIRHEGSITDYLEGIGSKSPSSATVPMIAVPTTAGTGSEATKNAVITRHGKGKFKKSLRHDAFIPATAVIDPLLAVGCPPDVTTACGMDAFSQLLESYVSTGATPVTDALARDGLVRFARGSRLFTENAYGTDDETYLRGELALAAYYSGLTLANAGLGTVHGMAGPIGAACEVPHGVVCGLLLAPIFRRIEAVEPQRRLAYAASLILRGESSASAEPRDTEAGLNLFEEWASRLPKLSRFGLSKKDIDEVAAASDNKKSPVQLDTEARREAILEIL